MDTSKVTRVEIIDHTKPLEEGGGRQVIVPANSIDDLKVKLSLQDDGRTLKVFSEAAKGPARRMMFTMPINRLNKAAIAGVVGEEAAKRLTRKITGGQSGQKGIRYESFFGAHRVARLIRKLVEHHQDAAVEWQSDGFIDDFVVRRDYADSFKAYQLKNSPTVTCRVERGFFHWSAFQGTTSGTYSHDCFSPQFASLQSHIVLMKPTSAEQIEGVLV